MPAIGKRKIGKTDVSVTEIGYGSAPLGDLFEDVPEELAQRTLTTAWDAGIRYFDTSPFYGYGKSEHRVGYFLRQKPHEEFILSTKVGRVFSAAPDLQTFDRGLWNNPLPFNFYYDYSYDGIMRTYEDSLQRLGMHAVELLLIHDLDPFFHNEAQIQAYLTQLFTSGWRALEELKSAGMIRGVGAGVNMMGMIPRFLDMMPLDFFILALPYTLLDQDALDVELPACEEHDVGIVIGAVFASGILVTGPTENATYKYAPATEEIMEKTRNIQLICERHGVSLAAAALQFPLGHPCVASVIPGAIQPAYVASNLENYRQVIPGDLWAELKHEGLLREDAPVPAGEGVFGI
ncbi:MAG: aldo/keto reductase [Candidatus Latescibacteria bacterium]|nr:aldo/keto reductase [Candidatus Latescibacterota bacterium]